MTRERCLEAIRSHLGVGELGRRFGLSQLDSIEKFRQGIPAMDLETHAREVEALLGFGAAKNVHTHLSPSGSAYQREAAIAVWRQFLTKSIASPRILRIEARARDPRVDLIRDEDLAVLGDVKRIERLAEIGGTQGLIERLRSFRPQILCVPSVHTCRWIEGQLRGPIHRELPDLELILAGADLRLSVRTHIPVVAAGLVHRAGRLTLPTTAVPAAAMDLAVDSTLIELRPHRPLAGMQPDETILPEQAIIGERYELIVSSALGFLRCRTDWHVRVVGFSPPAEPHVHAIPRILHLPRPPESVRLEGISVRGEWLTAGTRQAFHREDPALVAAVIGPDPAALGSRPDRGDLHDHFSETELGRLDLHKRTYRDPRPRGLLAQIEVQGRVRGRLAAQLSRRIDEDLCRRSPAYAHLRSRGELRGVRVVLVEPGTFETAKLRRIQTLRGAVELPQVRVRNDTSAPLYSSITQLPLL